MSTAGKTTDSTRLKLKEAQEELQELKLELRERDKRRDKANKSKRSSPKKQPRSLPDIESMDTVSIDEAQVISTVMKIIQDASTKAARPQKDNIEPDHQELEETMTEAQIIGAALSRKPKEAIEPDSDAMEEDKHPVIHIGSSSEDLSESSTSSSSSSSDSSTSSSSDGNSQDTQELINKLSSNPYLPLSNLKPKNLTKLDRSSGSKSDSASHQSSGQDSGSTSDHLPIDPSGNTGDAFDVAGVGD